MVNRKAYTIEYTSLLITIVIIEPISLLSYNDPKTGMYVPRFGLRNQLIQLYISCLAS